MGIIVVGLLIDGSVGELNPQTKLVISPNQLGYLVESIH